MKNLNCFIFTFFTLSMFGQNMDKESLINKNLNSFCIISNDTIKEKIDLDYIESDKKVITSLINKIVKNVSSLNDLDLIISKYESTNYTLKNYDLGYDINTRLYSFYGGYGTYYVGVISENNSVLKIKVTLGIETVLLEKYLIPEIDFEITCDNGAIGLEKFFTNNLKTIKNKDVFIESNDPNLIRKKSVNYFTDVLVSGNFQEPYYIQFGLGINTFTNLRYFIVNKDYESLENILFSVSPTSRLFAARTIKYMIDNYKYKPSDKIQKRMNEVYSKKQLIKSGILSCWENKFEYDYYDIDKNFDQYLKTED